MAGEPDRQSSPGPSQATQRPPPPQTRRATTPEIMDRPDVDPAELDRALGFIRLVNRRLGGARAALDWIDAWTIDWPPDRTIHVLDLGTGSADIPKAIVTWGKRRGRTVRITALDLHQTTIAAARRHVQDMPAIDVIQGDALSALERFGSHSFDIVHAGMFLHHLDDDSIVEVLRQMQAIARAGAIWNDLTRGMWPRIGVRVLTSFAPRMVRHDAIVSVDKGFTRTEAIDLAKAAGWANARYQRRLFGRFTVTTETLEFDTHEPPVK